MIRVGDTVTLRCPVPVLSRLGAARRGHEVGSVGTVEYVYEGGRVFEVRFGRNVVTVTAHEIGVD